MDLQTAFDRGFESVKAYIDAEFGMLAARINEIEARPIEKGDQGPQGQAGPPGPEGQPGGKGEKGDTGRDGRDAGDLTLIGSYIVEQIDSTMSERFKAFAMVTADGGRTFTATFGEHVCEVKTALILDRGVWTAERAYVPGDAVSHGGSLFIAQQDTNEKPGKSDHWRLAVKRGADGRDFRAEEKHQLEPVRFR